MDGISSTKEIISVCAANVANKEELEMFFSLCILNSLTPALFFSSNMENISETGWILFVSV